MGPSPLSRLIPALVLLLFVVQLGLLPVPRSDGHLLSSDGRYYYAYMRSFWLDHDVDLKNDMDLYNARVPSGSIARLDEWYVFSVGPGLLWSPFFLAGHGVARLAGAAHADGYSFVEEAFVELASVGYVALGLVLLLGVVRRLTPGGMPAAALTGMFLASPVIYYAVFEPTMSHTLEFFSVSLFMWLLFARPLRGNRDYLLLGAAAGLVFLVRWQNVVLWAVAAPLLLGRPPFERRPAPRHVLAAVAGAVVLIPLQFLFWKATAGSFVTVPQGAGFMTPFQPHIASVLFSGNHGLLSWHPALVLGIIGLAWVRPKALAWSLAAALVLDLYVCSIAKDWWGGEAFGMRRLTGAVPLLVVGFSALLAAIPSARRRAWVLGSVALLIAWNCAFMVQYRLNCVPHGSALSFREMALDKFRLPATLLRRVGR